MTRTIMRLSAIFFISLIAAAGAAQNQIKLWTVESMPNPMTDPEACGRDNVKHSAVCDPERIMSATGQAVVEELINNATSIEIAAVLMHYMDISVYRNDVDVAAEKLATGLHNKWGVGDAAKSNGVLILISVRDRATFISRGAGLKSALSDQTLDKIINRMKPHLKGAKWESGFASAILDITKVLSERGGKLEPENNSNSSDLLILLGVFSAIMCLGFYLEKIRKDKMAQLTRGREALNSLIHDAKSAEHKVYMTTSCPMCLENFDPETPSREIPPASTAGAPKTLPCGHVFCEPCIQQYLNTNATNCPVCRETIRHIDDGAPAVHEQAQGSASRHGYNNREHYTYMQMMMFRTRRIRNRYPTAMDASTHSVLEAAAHSGSLSDAITVVERRSIEVQTMIADMKKASTSSSGGGSSRSSFGGGRSSGGRGGRF